MMVGVCVYIFDKSLTSNIFLWQKFSIIFTFFIFYITKFSMTKYKKLIYQKLFFSCMGFTSYKKNPQQDYFFMNVDRIRHTKVLFVFTFQNAFKKI
jgi:hypothetical protein